MRYEVLQAQILRPWKKVLQEEALLMSWLYDYESFLYRNWYPFRAVSALVGYDQAKATIESNKAQIAYDEYLRAGNERAYNDWKKNVPGRDIKYPELSYPGAMYRADTGIARSMYSNDSAYSNLYRNTVYGSAGLYGITNRAARTL